jgi:hypothetical protein
MNVNLIFILNLNHIYIKFLNLIVSLFVFLLNSLFLYTVIPSKFRKARTKDRIESYIFLKIPKKKQ